MSLSGAVILQVIPDLSAGGAERTTVEIAEALKAVGATALVASQGGRLEKELAKAGGELVRMPKAGEKSPGAMAANTSFLTKLIKARGVNLVHARSRAPAWSALWAARKTKKPFVTTYHGVYSSKGPLKRLYNSVMARGDVVIANSEFTASHVRQQHPFAANRIVTIPRGVDIPAFTPDAVAHERVAKLAREWGVDRARGETVILLPGRLTAWKGQREAIRAAARLPMQDSAPAWRLVFAGDAQGRDDYEDELRELGETCGVGGRLAIVGHCSDMPAAFALADIVIAPSHRPEAFGRVAAEAGAMGVPVIGSDLGGQREIIVHDQTGLLTPPGDVNQLAAAMNTLLAAGKAGRERLGRAAMIRVREKFTTSALQQATLAVYDRLIGRPNE
jgi:glycosyltransferase involved in cell wall biosynthesis